MSRSPGKVQHQPASLHKPFAGSNLYFLFFPPYFGPEPALSPLPTLGDGVPICTPGPPQLPSLCRLHPITSRLPIPLGSCRDSEAEPSFPGPSLQHLPQFSLISGRRGHIKTAVMGTGVAQGWHRVPLQGVDAGCWGAVAPGVSGGAGLLPWTGGGMCVLAVTSPAWPWGSPVAMGATAGLRWGHRRDDAAGLGTRRGALREQGRSPRAGGPCATLAMPPSPYLSPRVPPSPVTINGGC